MGDRELENIISSIGQEELAVAQKQAQIDRLKQLIMKQKNEMTEQQKIINELNTRIQNMYDLPADVEELKRMVGDMRGEINLKNQQLEMAYGTVAEHEAELKNLKMQMNPLSRNLDSYISQIGELKAKVVEQEGILRIRDRDIHELRTSLNVKQQNFEKMEEEFAMKVQERLKSFMTSEDQYQERITKMESDYQSKLISLQDEIREKSLSSGQVRIKIESELKEEAFKERGKQLEQIRTLESQLLEKEIALKDGAHERENALKQVKDIKQHLDEHMAKFNKIQKEYTILQEKVKHRDEFYSDLKDFKAKNAGIAKNFEGLMNLFEKEPLFKTYLLVRDVGEMNIEDLKSTLGIPSITTKKYVEQFIKVDLFEYTEGGKVALKHKIKLD